LDELREQFRQEAQILARLSHPHLVRVGDFFEEEGNVYLAMDFVEGESLADHIVHQGALAEADVLVWADQLLDALTYCHSHGIIHRDIKPQNVIIRSDGQAVLVDFGLVKLWDPADPHTRTAMRGMGTPEYAPPEQYDIASGHTDPRSDVYSLGATLYHALTGRVPSTATARIANPQYSQPLRALNPQVSPRTEAVVARATELAVEKRFATARDMATALRGESPADSPKARYESAPTQHMMQSSAVSGADQVRPRRTSGLIWALVGAAALVLVIGVVAVGLILANRGRLSSLASPVDQQDDIVPAVLQETATPTASLQPSPTDTPVPSPTSAPTATPTATPTTAPTIRPTATPTSTPRPEASPVPTTPAPTSPPAQPTKPPASGALFTFEDGVNWRRGDEPYGELTQSSEQLHSGSYAAKLSYDFPVTDRDYVVFLKPVSLAGQPDSFGAWVYGDGSGHYLNYWVQDAQNQIWSVHLGPVGGPGWRQMVGKLDPSLPWPSGHVSGDDNGVVDYPVRFYALVLDRPGSGPQSGQIYIDDISVWQARGEASSTPTPAPAQPGATDTPVATEAAVSTGPLDFPVPQYLDAWETAEGGYRATIVVRIGGGAPPFTVYHDSAVVGSEVQERDYLLIFQAAGCTIVHSITVESADGQRASHDYYIRSPWCD
jgi:serine/threonine protein kinase